MDYKSIVQTAYKNGGGEAVMNKSIDVTNRLIEKMRETHEDEYKSFIRELYAELYGRHYNKEFAEHDVELLFYTDKDGAQHHGAHWTLEQVLSATSGKSFAKGVTDYDKFVAYNAAYADFSKEFDDEQILCIAYLLFFADEDWKGDCKIWDYMQLAAK